MQFVRYLSTLETNSERDNSKKSKNPIFKFSLSKKTCFQYTIANLSIQYFSQFLDGQPKMDYITFHRIGMHVLQSVTRFETISHWLGCLKKDSMIDFYRVHRKLNMKSDDCMVIGWIGNDVCWKIYSDGYFHSTISTVWYHDYPFWYHFRFWKKKSSRLQVLCFSLSKNRSSLRTILTYSNTPSTLSQTIKTIFSLRKVSSLNFFCTRRICRH